jgi:hypothetical protein
MTWNVQKRVAFVPVSRELLNGPSVDEIIMDGFVKYFRPWDTPDPNPMPTFTPFPRMQRTIDDTRSRIHDIRVAVATAIDPTEDDDW